MKRRGAGDSVEGQVDEGLVIVLQPHPLVVLDVEHFHTGVDGKSRDDFIDHLTIGIRLHVLLAAQDPAV